MTRINLVEPSMLTDQHLMAEYKELPRIFTLAIKAYNKYTQHDYTFFTIYLETKHHYPACYTLGRGHVSFFYNKCQWVYNRLEKVRIELIKRGYDLNSEIYTSILETVASIRGNKSLWNNWKPSHAEVYLNMQRLVKNYFKSVNQMNDIQCNRFTESNRLKTQPKYII